MFHFHQELSKEDLKNDEKFERDNIKSTILGENGTNLFTAPSNDIGLHTLSFYEAISEFAPLLLCGDIFVPS